MYHEMFFTVSVETRRYTNTCFQEQRLDICGYRIIDKLALMRYLFTE